MLLTNDFFLSHTTQYAELAKAITEVPTTGLGVWRTLLSSGDRDLVHRATVAIRKFYTFSSSNYRPHISIHISYY